MEQHLRYAEVSLEIQKQVLRDIVVSNSALMDVLTLLRDERLPQALVGGGAVYQSVWNHLTGRPLWNAIKDIDIIYFDEDLSYEAEDRVIKRFESLLTGAPAPAEIRNQARLHLWFGQKFGHEVPPLRSSAEALTRYASRPHAVAIRLDMHGAVQIEAPFGLRDLFAFQLTPNTLSSSRQAHIEKGERAKAVWPELTVVPWD